MTLNKTQNFENKEKALLKDYGPWVLIGFSFVLSSILLIFFVFEVKENHLKNNVSKVLYDIGLVSNHLEVFFQEREHNLEALLLNQEFSTYYKNLDLGMSKEYGLNVSIGLMREKMKLFLNLIKIDTASLEESHLFQCLIFLSNDNEVLVDTLFPQMEGKKFSNHPYYKEGLFDNKFSIVQPDGNQSTLIFMYEDYHFNEKVRGKLIATIPQDILFETILTSKTDISIVNGIPIGMASSEVTDFIQNNPPMTDVTKIGDYVAFKALRKSDDYKTYRVLTLEEYKKLFMDKKSENIFYLLVLVVFTLFIYAFILKRKSDKEKEVMNKRLMQTSKLASLGTMAAGVAHEVNNPLTIIKGRAQLLKMKFQDNELLQKYIIDIENALSRINDITRHMLFYGRESTNDQFRPTNLKDVIENALKLFKPMIEKSFIHFDFWCDDGNYVIHGDPAQIESVVHNFLKNSLDAINEKREKERSFNGLISIKLYSLLNDAIMEFCDNGGGINPNIIEKVFDPFFSTKAVGQGTGLGMAMAQTIVKDLKGHIKYENNYGVGIKFFVSLPIRPS